MDSKIGFIEIIVEDIDNIPELNSTLSEYGESIIGRLGIPYHEKKINIITVVVDASEQTINNLFLKLKDLRGIKVNVTR